MIKSIGKSIALSDAFLRPSVVFTVALVLLILFLLLIFCLILFLILLLVLIAFLLILIVHFFTF